MVSFDDSLAAVYGRTRYLPGSVASRLMWSVASSADGSRVPRVADIGCGVGRHALGLAQCGMPFAYRGFDSSRAMLEHIPKELRRDSRFRFVEVDCSKQDQLGGEEFDFVIAHWVSNVSPAWTDILDTALTTAKTGGCVVWFSEQSDLYAAIDGRGTAVAWQFSVVGAFWSVFYTALGPWAEPGCLERRIGVRINALDGQRYLESRGCQIVALSDAEVRWHGSATCRWLLDHVIRPRAFSNFRLIPENRFAYAVHECERFVDRYPIASTISVRIAYACYPIIAAKRVSSSSLW